MPAFLQALQRTLFSVRSKESDRLSSEGKQQVSVVRKRVKHARIMVHHDGGVQFVVPFKFSDERINLLLDKNTNWIEKQRERFARLARFELGNDEILYRGTTYKFRLARSLGEEVFIYPSERVIQSGTDLLDKTHQETWLRDEARRVIPPRVEALAERVGLKYSDIKIRSQKTIWGSCSAHAVLSFNWRLVKSPSSVLDYLIIHELVHTEIADHSLRFWRRVGELCPRYEESLEWLKSYGRWI